MGGSWEKPTQAQCEGRTPHRKAPLWRDSANHWIPVLFPKWEWRPVSAEIRGINNFWFAAQMVVVLCSSESAAGIKHPLGFIRLLPFCRDSNGIVCEVWFIEENLWSFCVVSDRNQIDSSKVREMIFFYTMWHFRSLWSSLTATSCELDLKNMGTTSS